MKKYRIRYLTVTILMIIFTIYFANRVFLAITLILLLLPLLLKFSILSNSDKFKLEIMAKDGTSIKSDIGLVVSYWCSYWLSVAGLLIIEAEFINNVFEVVAKKTYVVPLCQYKEKVELPYSARFCGKLTVSFKAIRICDFLGLFSKEINTKADKNIIIYPRNADITVLVGQQNRNNVNIGQVNSGKKGNDSTEIFYLREYQEGDPIKSIHWKLSSKYDKLIVKQNSDLFNYEVLYLIDISLKKQGIKYEKGQISTVLEMGIEIGKSIIAANVEYELALPVDDNEICNIPIGNVADHYLALKEALTSKINPNIDLNSLLEKYVSDILNRGYSKLILVCWENYPSTLDYLSNFLEVVVIIIYDHNKQLDTVKSKNLHIVTLPDDKLFNSNITINI